MRMMTSACCGDYMRLSVMMKAPSVRDSGTEPGSLDCSALCTYVIIVIIIIIIKVNVSMPVGVERIFNYLTLFNSVCHLHTECV